MTNHVSALTLGRKIIELLSCKPGEEIDLAKTRDGSVLIRRVSES
jgi:hypothetical protein